VGWEGAGDAPAALQAKDRAHSAVPGRGLIGVVFEI